MPNKGRRLSNVQTKQAKRRRIYQLPMPKPIKHFTPEAARVMLRLYPIYGKNRSLYLQYAQKTLDQTGRQVPVKSFL